AGMGALLALWLTNTELSVVAQIALVLLIGIVEKNAIMMIDFALVAERVHRALPAHHDDDDGGHTRRAADRHRPGRRQRPASPVGHCPGRRLVRVTEPDPAQHARAVRGFFLSRRAPQGLGRTPPCAPLARRAASPRRYLTVAAAGSPVLSRAHCPDQVLRQNGAATA